MAVTSASPEGVSSTSTSTSSARPPLHVPAGTDRAQDASGTDSRLPYELQASLSCASNDTCRFVVFSPWTRAFLSRIGVTSNSTEPWQKAWLAMVAHWANVVAIVQSNSITFMRLKDHGPHEIILKVHERPVDGAERGLYTLAWTYDPVRLVPIIAVAGKSKLIYIWRLGWDELKGQADASRLRVLKGHGGEIYALQFHPTDPHILASASKDTTVRLWNIFGSDAPASSNPVHAMGTGDEGSVLVGLLAGGTVGGHVEGVTALDFHPRLPLIVTGGLDHTLKIWPLPRFPPPFTPLNAKHSTYRCFHPLFSSRLIVSGIINSVSWYTEDTLLTYTAGPFPKVVKWKWLSLDRHFPRPSPSSAQRQIRYAGSETDSLRAQRSEYDDSYSYHTLTFFAPSSTTFIAPLPDPPTRGTSHQPSWTSYAGFSPGSVSLSTSSIYAIPTPSSNTGGGGAGGVTLFHPDEPHPPREGSGRPKVAYAEGTEGEGSSEDEEDEGKEEGEEEQEVESSSSSQTVRRPGERDLPPKHRDWKGMNPPMEVRKEDEENEREMRRWFGGVVGGVELGGAREWEKRGGDGGKVRGVGVGGEVGEWVVGVGEERVWVWKRGGEGGGGEGTKRGRWSGNEEGKEKEDWGGMMVD